MTLTPGVDICPVCYDNPCMCTIGRSLPDSWGAPWPIDSPMRPTSSGANVTVTDLFAGAGGSSTGLAGIPGVRIRYAANHWQLACDVHNANHPDTDHAAVDLHQEDPKYFATTDLLWASPECTKWSQASGDSGPAIEEGLFEDPLSDEARTRSRLLMFDVLRFAEHHRYRAMIIENVVDVATQAKYSLAWHEWRRQLHELGYRYRVVSLNSMHAQAFGPPAPQSRDRIYIVCWRNGEKAPDLDRILRPKAFCPKCDQVIESSQAFKPGKDVGRYRQAYVYVHAQCGTTVEPGWLPAAAAIDWSIPGERIGDRLKPKTRARIAAGIARYWGPIHIEAAGNQYDAADPKHPQHGDPNAYYRAWSMQDVIRTLHTQETKALAIPVEGRDGKEAWPMNRPLRTMTTRNETAMVHPPFVAELYGTSTARRVSEPAGTFTAGGNHHGLVTTAGGSWNDDARPTDEALRTLTTRDAYALVTSYYGSSTDARPTDRPIGTLTTVDRYALIHRNNTGGAEMTTPVMEELRTLTTHGHQSLLQQPRPRISPADLRAAQEMVPEVLFRMFQPSEVAAGMAFPADYNWHPDPNKRVSNRDLVRMGGNAVTPPTSRDVGTVVVESITGDAA
ncbi:DNA cytosine methyltransferase [Occultella kanbiaonis]|uniref:DNA cytosine methyltransferase n=1 Tax=Occultella kanbiaonis TaxID=2675754 RepID=UPI001F247770|nr:DNA cytosine methyltransferase [Occultella kanbiaonis]